MDEFVNLGTLITYNNGVIRKVRERNVAANRVFFGLQNKLKSLMLRTKAKLSLYENLIIPTVLYGHESNGRTSRTLREAYRRASNVKYCDQYSAINRKMLSGVGTRAANCTKYLKRWI